MDRARSGIASGGNWIVDRVKTVSCLPSRGMLANIRSESRSTGGAPANVLMDLARLGSPFPLSGWGLIGADTDGEFVLSTCRQYHIDITGIGILPGQTTSYTDVMNEESTGDRSFYHYRGANATFGPSHVAIHTITSRIFHLGYLLLLDAMDQPHAEYGTVAASFLRDLQNAGIRTSLDVVSEDSDRFRQIVPPALRYVNYVILNEIEAGRIAGITVRGTDGALNGAALRQAAEIVASYGRMDLLAIHMPEGVYLRNGGGQESSLGSRVLPAGFIRSALGAGDAFCAGMLWGLHEGWSHRDSAELGIATATACLTDTSATNGVRSVREVQELADRYPRRPPPVIL